MPVHYGHTLKEPTGAAVAPSQSSLSRKLNDTTARRRAPLMHGTGEPTRRGVESLHGPVRYGHIHIKPEIPSRRFAINLLLEVISLNVIYCGLVFEQ